MSDKVIPNNTVPPEKWYGIKPIYRKLKVFGCIAYVRKPKIQVNSKFDSRSKKCVLLGNADNGYRLWSLDEKKMIVACDVVFDENKRLNRLDIVAYSLHADVMKFRNLKERDCTT
jgi:hypothetical protein